MITEDQVVEILTKVYGQRAKGKNNHLIAYIFSELYLSSKVNW